jgi:alanyl-tRNA synthetase
MEYKKTEQGFEPLPQKNVDFGGGLERIAAAVLNDANMFNTSVFSKAKEIIDRVSTKEVDETSQRVLLDHLRAATFLISDGVNPSNKDQGYFVRRLVRRAIRFGKNIGVQEEFTSEIAAAFIDEYKDAYPELDAQREQILGELSREEAKFRKTLVKGEREFEKMFEQKGAISGEDAFILYSTYGFPIELSEEMAQEKGQEIDREVFKAEFNKHKDLSRAGAQQKFAGGLSDHSDATVALHTATHMLHQALKTVLGDHVEQKGSNITPERLRFDFSHPEKLTDDQKKQVEDLINDNIQKALPVHFELLDLNEAKERGAIGLFEDKYAQLGEQVKVYFIGDQATGHYYSREVCGGPQVETTTQLGVFRIKIEKSVADGVRRIKAVLEEKS